MEQCTGDNKKKLNLSCVEGKHIECYLHSISLVERHETKSVDESLKVDKRTFDQIMIDAFEKCDSKSSRIRLNALKSICTQLQLTHNPTFLTKHIDRLVNIIENALQSNVPCEIDATANVISLAAIQLPDTNRSMQMFYEPLKASLINENLKSSVRSAVCNAVGILTFLYRKDDYEISMVMKEFKDIFMPNSHYHKGTNNRIQITNWGFQVAAFETWMFLMTLLSSHLENDKTSPFPLRSVEVIFLLLKSPNFDMRVACAKAVAVIIECGSDKDREYLVPHLTKIVGKISPIVNARNKHGSDIKSTAEVLLYLEVN